ncbi:hypothetical protein [Reyranella sp. CPCC 100927]|uniref:hypothetical protein n=1 Tax=Reyranella sp. CPCC 100927 TaxID=2599616 RepID=UPI0011B7DDAE|nr:hypothetical protein [Reyranella sp. CPCC 100927]TWT00308.1 hypothetical protein FQU96_33835 [Reyranella sp. CPCC 100927]
MLELIALVAALVLCVWTPIETRKVRDGWMRKNFQGTHAEFVAKYRRQLTVIGWVGMVLGTLNLVLAAVAASEPGFIVKLIAGIIWLVAGGISLWSRRILDEPRPA